MFNKGKMKAHFYIVLLAILIFIVYASAINKIFLFDDEILVKNNPLITSFSNIPIFFKTDIFSYQSGKKESVAYRPLQTLSYAVDHFFWGKGPRGYHITNVIIHIFNCIFVFVLLEMLFNHRPIAFFSALFFGIHPVHTQSVTYISGRADCMFALFILLGMVLYIQYVKSSEGDISYPFIISFVYLMALLSKEASILLFPLALLMLHVFFFAKKRIPMFVYGILVFSLGVYLFLRRISSIGAFRSNIDFAPRVLTSLKSLFINMRIILFPYDLSFGRTTDLVPSIFHPAALATIVGLCMIGVAGRLYMKRWKEKKDLLSGVTAFGLAWYLVFMIPYLNIIPLQVFLSENWLYISSLGIVMVVVAQVLKFSKKWLVDKRARFMVLAVLGISLFITYGYTTFLRNMDYADEERFYLSNLKNRPIVKFYFLLGTHYGLKGRYKEAIGAFEKGIEANKIYPSSEVLRVHYNLAVTYLKLEEWEKAIHQFQVVADLDKGPVREEALRYIKALKSEKGILP